MLQASQQVTNITDCGTCSQTRTSNHRQTDRERGKNPAFFVSVRMDDRGKQQTTGKQYTRPQRRKQNKQHTHHKHTDRDTDTDRTNAHRETHRDKQTDAKQTDRQTHRPHKTEAHRDTDGANLDGVLLFLFYVCNDTHTNGHK